MIVEVREIAVEATMPYPVRQVRLGDEAGVSAHRDAIPERTASVRRPQWRGDSGIEGQDAGRPRLGVTVRRNESSGRPRRHNTHRRQQGSH